MYYSVRRSLDLGVSEAQQIELLNFLCSYTIQHAMVPGKIETYNFVIDLAGISVMEVPFNLIKTMANCLRVAYKLRIHNIIVTSVDWRIEYACKFLYKILPQRLTDKIKIFSDNGSQFLTQLTSKNQL